MKNCILKGLCVIFILLFLLIMMIPATFAAQDGHGGVTEVIARVTNPDEEATDPAQPSTEPSLTPADSQPVQTGETVAWIALLILLLSAVVLLILWLKRDDRSNKSDC